MAVQSKMWVCGHSPAGIAGLKPAGGMDVCRECCVLSGRCLCVRLITHPVASNKCSKCNYILRTSKLFIYDPLHNACSDISNLFVLVVYLVAYTVTLYRIQCLGDCELQTGKNVEGSSLGIIDGTILPSAWWD